MLKIYLDKRWIKLLLLPSEVKSLITTRIGWEGRRASKIIQWHKKDELGILARQDDLSNHKIFLRKSATLVMAASNQC